MFPIRNQYAYIHTSTCAKRLLICLDNPHAIIRTYVAAPLGRKSLILLGLESTHNLISIYIVLDPKLTHIFAESKLKIDDIVEVPSLGLRAA